MMKMTQVIISVVKMVKINNNTSLGERIDLKKVVNFFSGADEPPPGGFPFQPEINFNDSNPYPTASTCAVQLTLPTKYDNYKDFKKNFDIALLYHGGFGLS